ncbi:zinc finger protein 836-like [Lucilia sericata]|uniref:zinc finger protein 836-like n=1 Tax=Lucilia sericata TaxID=13632 RepID=UPI0018A8675D|nr:zinc finger protein 836-like [Lucilia sericata]
MNKAMRKITYYENILEFKENTKEELNLNEINNWQLCRTCLIDSKEDDVDLEKMRIMDVMEGSFLSIKEMLVQTTNIKMCTTENLPTKVCKECFSKITALYYFCIQVHKADKILIKLDHKLKGYKDEVSEFITEEVNSCNENELPEDSILLEVEELFDIENVEDIAKNLSDPNIMDKEEESKKDLEKTVDDKESLEYYEDVAQLEGAFLADDELDDDIKSEEENYLEKDLLEAPSTSSSEHEEDEVVVPPKIVNCPKKRKVCKAPPMSGYRHKQPRVTSPLLTEISCAICQNTFERQQDLVNHVRSLHPNSKAYKCRVCGNLFSHIQSLSRHMNNHKEAVVFNECEYCTKTFIRVDDLKRHLRVHTGERPYACSFCEKSFQQSTDLKLHEEKHYLTKTFECTECKAIYTSRNGLYLHKRKHHKQKSDIEKELRYACNLCEMSFQQPLDLKNHQKKHFLSEIIKCDQCENTYISRKGLSLHKKKHHSRNDGRQTENENEKEMIDELLGSEEVEGEEKETGKEKEEESLRIEGEKESVREDESQ